MAGELLLLQVQIFFTFHEYMKCVARFGTSCYLAFACLLECMHMHANDFF